MTGTDRRRWRRWRGAGMVVAALAPWSMVAVGYGAVGHGGVPAAGACVRIVPLSVPSPAHHAFARPWARLAGRGGLWALSGVEFPGKPVALINTSGRGSHHAQDALVEILRAMSATVLDDVSGTVPLPGIGCEPAWIVGQPALREALSALLARLDGALAQA